MVGFSAPVFAGVVLDCDDELAIEISALRGGGPTVTGGGYKDITAKARILKGSSDPADTVVDTTLDIEAFKGNVSLATAASDKLLTLVVGKGGQGDKVSVGPIACSVGQTIDFVATFRGTSPDGAECVAVSDRLPKTCK
jgi:uncharacterized repeat protein (TIGR01451 family)